jgi:Flp pilus assembly pilin Flp
MIRFLQKSEQGQTSVEYILLIVVAVSIGMLFMKRMNEYVINNPKGIIGGPLTKFTKAINQDPSGRFRTYQLPTSRRK